MNRNISILLALIGVAVLFSTATSQQPPVVRRSVFSTVKAGQAVSLKERAGLYEIGTTDEGGPLTHKVVEVGDDYFVVKDDAGTVESRIPVTAVRVVVHTKTKEK